MYRKFLLFGLLFVLGTSLASAQDKKYEINGLLGFTLSEGVDVNPVKLDDDLVIDRVSPKSGFSFGLGFDYFVSENFSVGFNWAQEQSKLRGDIQGLQGLDFTDMNVNNFHVLFTYNLGAEDDYLRPYFLGGLGATHYSPGSVGDFSVDSATKFSTTWGGGVKYFTTDHIGFKGGLRWTPTYIKSDPSGIYCSPFWPWSCWVVGDANYSHQFEFSAGVVVRF